MMKGNKFYRLLTLSTVLALLLSFLVSVAPAAGASVRLDPKEGDIGDWVEIKYAGSEPVRFYFSDNELNGRTLNQLLAFRLDGAEWLEEPGPYHRADAGAFNYVEVENLDEFSQFGLSEFLMGKSSFLPNVLRDPD